MWQCPNCGESLEDSFEACWNCGTGQDGTPNPDFVREPEDAEVPDSRPRSQPDAANPYATPAGAQRTMPADARKTLASTRVLVVILAVCFFVLSAFKLLQFVFGLYWVAKMREFDAAGPLLLQTSLPSLVRASFSLILGAVHLLVGYAIWGYGRAIRRVLGEGPAALPAMFQAERTAYLFVLGMFALWLLLGIGSGVVLVLLDAW